MLTLLLTTAGFAQDRGARADDAAFEDPETPPPPRDRLWYSNATFVRVNPLGLVDLHKLGWRRRLSTSPSILFSDTYFFAGASALVSPAYSRLGVYAEVQPIALFRAFAEVTGVGYYGSFDQVLTWDDPTARYSDQTISARGADAEAALGYTATFGATLQAKVGPIAARSTGQVTTIGLGLGEEGLYFYDQYSDRLAPDGGWLVLNDLDVLYVQGKLRAGVRHTFSDTLDGRRDGSDSALSHHRLGPLFAWQFVDKAPGAKFNQPTLFMVAQWWLQHPYRAGEEQSQALPLIAVGLAFNGDYKISSP